MEALASWLVMMTKILPYRLASILEVAMADLAKCENNSEFKIDMNSWHEVKDNIRHVGLAGAVMAQTLGCGLKDSTPPNFKGYTFQLEAIDSLQYGSVKTAMYLIDDRQRYNSYKRLNVTSYHEDSNKFKHDISKVLDYLR